VSSTDAWLVVGLGNPGPTYERTRHNIGAIVIDELAQRFTSPLKRHKRALAEVAEIRIGEHKVVIAKPLSYMNESGGPVKALASFYKVPLVQIIVLHDELDIPLGTIRLKLGGGDNGHNGLKSIRGAFGSGEWHRVRLGIGRPPGNQDPSDFVLKPFSSTENVEVAVLRENGAEATQKLITDGLLAAQSTFNS
jgi:PTH1 family peptidyl-tRNA hydrolase